jgi:hypothetical protein
MTRGSKVVPWPLFVACLACQTSPTSPTSGPPSASPPPAITRATTGTFDLTLHLADTCTAVPPEQRTRRYTASVAVVDRRAVVTLGGARFLEGPSCTGHPVPGGVWRGRLGCNQFRISEDLDWIDLDLQGEAVWDELGGHIVERLPTGAWLRVAGTGGGEVRDWDDFVVSLDGHAWYCPDAVEHPLDAPCAAGPGSSGSATAQSCALAGSQVRFVRR